MDVIVYVLKVGYRGPNCVKARVVWFNKRGMCLNITQNIRIEACQFPHWRQVTAPEGVQDVPTR